VRVEGVIQEYIDFDSDPQAQLNETAQATNKLQSDIEALQAEVDAIEIPPFMPITELVFFRQGTALNLLQNVDRLLGFEPTTDAAQRTAMRMLKVYGRGVEFSVSWSTASTVGEPPTTLSGPVNCIQAIIYPQGTNTSSLGSQLNNFANGYVGVFFTTAGAQIVSGINWLSIHHGSNLGPFGEIIIYSPFPARIIGA
jgi:hypothetical protein